MVIPYGIIVDGCVVAIGGLIGGLLKKVLPKRIVDALFIITAFCAFGIGIVATIKLSSLTVVMGSVILGCVIGELCLIETGIDKLIGFTVGKLNRKSGKLAEGLSEEEKQKAQADTNLKIELLSMAMAIICFSGTGFFGALTEGLDGDHSILLAKSVLDFFTVVVIAAQIGCFVSVFAIPQVVIYLICFFLATLISPILTAESIANFKAVGGILTLVIGYNILANQVGLKKVRVLNLTPAFILVLFFSWVATFLPFTI